MRKTEKSKKFRGVRQRHWGSWVSEIRHPLLKKRVWLGTFESAEAAARAYDEAAILMNGRNAKTNFPAAAAQAAGGGSPAAQKANNLSEILHAKLSKRSKTPSSRSVTCLRLDTESCNIGVWQMRGGSGGRSSPAAENSEWVLTVELGKVESSRALGRTGSPSPELNRDSGDGFSAKLVSGESDNVGDDCDREDDDDDDQDRLARQMIEELLLT